MATIKMDIWRIFDKYLSNINYPYKMTIRKDVEGDYLYNEIRDIVKRHFPKSFHVEQIKRGVYYIVQNRHIDFSMANIIYNCVK